MITISEPDAKLVARVLEEDVEAMLNGDRRLPAPDGCSRLLGIVSKLREERDAEGEKTER